MPWKRSPFSRFQSGLFCFCKLFALSHGNGNADGGRESGFDDFWLCFVRRARLACACRSCFGVRWPMIRRILLSLAVCLLGMLAGCSISEWNQKMVLVVETPEGIKTGESVVRIGFTANRMDLAKSLPGAKVKWIPHGEAVVVDLGERGVLIALLKGEKGYMGDAGPNASFAFNTGRFYPGSEETIENVLDQRTGVAVLIPRKAYPLLVTFRDISDPSTIEQVDPDDLAKSFGEGVRLKSLTLERTEEDMTDGPLPEMLPCHQKLQQCVPVDFSLPYDDRMRSVPNWAFWSN
ncbi:hypothetical protein [Jiella marina]|uniref:hypothetical protein n=1 Tax=Jiella sp. LLJ827 TaxID=2917712 RepID=UPI0021016F01|nr:hypothetical protein [Jiella sp. LLJ827]MCQ0987122.1 hypothetical protein [Jiella sp. LLJ827]